VALHEQRQQLAMRYIYVRDVRHMCAIHSTWSALERFLARRMAGSDSTTRTAKNAASLREKRLKEAGADLSAGQAMLAAQTIRYVRFEVGGQARRGVTAGSAQARQVLAALVLGDLRPPHRREVNKRRCSD
jgi:hypothetical protein